MGGVSTGKENVESLPRFFKAAADNPRTGQPTDSDASVLLRRLKLCRLTVRLEAPDPHLPPCARCFAQLVLIQDSDSAGRERGRTANER